MSDEKTPELEYIKTHANEIFFYSEVSVESIEEFSFQLSKLDKELRCKYIELGIEEQPTIKVYIHSPGGDLHAGLGAMDHIRCCKSKVITIADGFTASAAAMMYLGGHERHIKKNTYLLIHQLSSEVWGSYEDLRSEMDNIEKLMKKMKSICSKCTEIPEHKLEQLMTKDIILSAKRCLKYGVSSKVL
jgi:ATP-dependent Clp endopeptidase proteolytic subunit ClpP